MDLLQGVRDAQAEEPQLQDQDFEPPPHPEGGFQMPSKEAILQMLEKLNMSDEEKDKIREGLSKNYGKHLQGQHSNSLSAFFIVVPCILILILTFGKANTNYFAYKYSI